MKPSDIGLPSRFEKFRPHQEDIITSAANDDHKCFLLDLPTGTGKTVIGVGVQRLLKKQAVYLVSTKQLQDQIVSEFPGIVGCVMGRNNYTCRKHPMEFPEISCEDCTNSESNPCDYSGSCNYKTAKRKAMSYPLVVLNYSYFLREANGVGGFSGRDIMIADEIDTVESELMSFIEFQVTERFCMEHQIPAPWEVKDIYGLIQWAENTYPAAVSILRDINDMIETIPEESGDRENLEIFRKSKRLDRFVNMLGMFIAESGDQWVFDISENNDRVTWIARPIYVSGFGHHYLWRHVDRILGMSGTIMNPSALADAVGLPSPTYRAIPSPFPIKNRPIYYQPVANVVKKNMSVALPVLCRKVTEIIRKYPDEKVLVHTVSYAIRDYLMQNLPQEVQNRIITHDTVDRMRKLEAFKYSKQSLVMISPSFTRGVSLDGKQCRCIIVCKVPFMNIGDAQVKKRMSQKGGYLWYHMAAAQTLVQMTGRAVRSNDDHADTFVLDEQFGNKMGHFKRYIPGWWLDALITEK